MSHYSNDPQINKFIITFLKTHKKWKFKKGKKHNKLVSPNKLCCPIPKTPSCSRAYQNFIHDIRKYN